MKNPTEEYSRRHLKATYIVLALWLLFIFGLALFASVGTLGR